MAKDLLHSISEGMSGFSKGQKLIARYIIENYDKAAFMTASKLGNTVGVSESTVVRFATEVGFEGYPQLQRALQELIRNRLTAVQRMEVTSEQMGEHDILSKVLTMDIEKIRRTLEEQSNEGFEAAADSIIAAKNIYILGIRSSAALAQFMSFYFNQIFPNVRLVTGSSASEMFEQIFRVGKDDVFIGISFPRYSKRTVKAIDYAKERGATVIAITDSAGSPLAAKCDHLLLARSDMASFVDSLVAPLSLINALIVAVGMRRQKVGRKLLITGKGRCNVTNNCDEDSFLKAVRRNPRFLYSAINRFSTADTMAFFEGLGVPLKTERGNRVFPVSDRAADIVDALHRYVKRSGAELREGEAKELLLDETGVRGVICKDGSEIYARRVAVATGGVSYPQTGSTGDGYRFAKQAGHTVVPAVPSLVPIVTREDYCREMMGLSLRNVTLTVRRAGKKKPVFSELGEMLFTHFGVSGPLVLSASSHMTGDLGEYSMEIDLKPGLTVQQLDARLLRDFEKFINKDFSNALDELLPRKLIPVAVRLSGIAPDTKVNQITREEREKLISVIKAFPVTPVRFRPVEEAIVTSGGVKVSEVDPHTMESRLVPGLYFIGEVLDLDAYTGGYNLQIAFSTARLAAQSMAEGEMTQWEG